MAEILDKEVRKELFQIPFALQVKFAFEITDTVIDYVYEGNSDFYEWLVHKRIDNLDCSQIIKDPPGLKIIEEEINKYKLKYDNEEDPELKSFYYKKWWAWETVLSSMQNNLKEVLKNAPLVFIEDNDYNSLKEIESKAKRIIEFNSLVNP